ncbi:MaoC family dehydratase [Jatrophihabitans sp.]|uniref:MaoC family dehydratase n=1 Tax=Jatrophihabitans sp. TaxID=1932789 RepID=UPI0030C6FFAB|nr:hypothetical protein [Jatrophihabitans sp.]
MSAAAVAVPYRTTRVMTAREVEGYPVALETGAARGSEVVVVGANIHTDDALARANGLGGRVADGMIVGNWLYQAAVAVLGPQMLELGQFRVKFIRPVYVGDEIELVVDAPADRSGGVALRAEVLGEVRVVGAAMIGPAEGAPR